VFHGIGEQRPMSTLRGFVEAVLSSSNESQAPPFFNKPDRMAESFELRRLEAPGSRHRPPSDFYEYYWAYHMQGTQLRQVVAWLRTLLFRLPHNVSVNLRVVWALSWALLLGAIYVFLSWRIDARTPFGAEVSGWVSLGLTGAFGLIQAFVVHSLGDAARYMSPLPANIAVRNAIRKEAIDLLRRMQASGDYDRIIVVGHSLGSVIAYDVLARLWDQTHAVHTRPSRPHQTALDAVHRSGAALLRDDTPENLHRFRQDQADLWQEQRQWGNPWLVTDFISVGSPLAHAAMFLALSEEDLRRRQAERELPVCPPVRDKGTYAPRRFTYTILGRKSTLRVLHYAAPFACTRWTNLYFPVRMGLLGDWVGGPLRPVFGLGIEDVPIRHGWVRFVPLLGHTHYWKVPRKTPSEGSNSALQVLQARLGFPSDGLQGGADSASGAKEPDASRRAGATFSAVREKPRRPRRPPVRSPRSGRSREGPRNGLQP